MISGIMQEALNITYTYLSLKVNETDLKKLCNSIKTISNIKKYTFKKLEILNLKSYEDVQGILSNLNEKETIRKIKGVYYTPNDVVNFILYNSMKAVNEKIESSSVGNTNIDISKFKSFCLEKSVFDPTCGTGVFLLACLELKLHILESTEKNITINKVKNVLATIHGNDVNKDSISITKIRLFLSLFNRYGYKCVSEVEKILNKSFKNYDFVQEKVKLNKKFDIIIGNPPYVEDSKSGLNPETKYGNIYANVLKNSALMLKKQGVLAFIIPLSYIATPRMRKIREDLEEIIHKQYILSYSDRPDCLFTSVHQKLCILIGIKSMEEKSIYTSNYQYWYKEERKNLFKTTTLVKNNYFDSNFIPKLGNDLDVSIYEKLLQNNDKESLLEMFTPGSGKIYLNMRATFWIKAFLNKHIGSEYREYTLENQSIANYVMCLLNSSLFWWYWICISDCWHITRKELKNFLVPKINDFIETDKLANKLERKLEMTKVYVGTKQVEYEYKHKKCIKEIHDIDDYINKLYKLNKEESVYIKKFAYKYRMGEGVNNEKIKGN